MKLKPLANRLVIKPVKKEEKKGKIIIPDTSEEEKSQQGKILALGEGKKVRKLGLKVNDRVLYKEYGPSEIEINEEKLLIADYDDVLGVIK